MWNQPPVDARTAVDGFDPVAGDADDTFDEVLLGLLGELEDDDGAARRWKPREQAAVGERDHRSVRELVHEDVVAHFQRGNHRTAGDLERLDHECAQQQGDDDGDEDGLAVFAQLTLTPAGEGCIDGFFGLGEGFFETRAFESLGFHDFAKGAKPVLECLSLRRGHCAFEVFLVASLQASRFVQQSLRLLEPLASGDRDVVAPADPHLGGEGKHVALAPQHHLEDREQHDRDGHRLVLDHRAQQSEWTDSSGGVAG